MQSDITYHFNAAGVIIYRSCTYGITEMIQVIMEIKLMDRNAADGWVSINIDISLLMEMVLSST